MLERAPEPGRCWLSSLVPDPPPFSLRRRQGPHRLIAALLLALADGSQATQPTTRSAPTTCARVPAALRERGPGNPLQVGAPRKERSTCCASSGAPTGGRLPGADRPESRRNCPAARAPSRLSNIPLVRRGHVSLGRVAAQAPWRFTAGSGPAHNTLHRTGLNALPSGPQLFSAGTILQHARI